MKKEIISLTSNIRTFYLDYENNKILDEGEQLHFDIMNPSKHEICQILLRMYKLKEIEKVIDDAIIRLNNGNFKKLFIITGKIFDNTIRTEDFKGNICIYLGLKLI